MRRIRLAALTIAVMAAIAVAALWWLQRPKRLRLERFPAVVLITVDTLNVYFTHLYDASRSDTRNLVRLAEDGVWLRDAYTTVPMTLPSHTALFSGRLPEEVGVMANGDLVRPGVRTLAEILRDAGYATAAFPGSTASSGVPGASPGKTIAPAPACCSRSSSSRREDEGWRQRYRAPASSRPGSRSAPLGLSSSAMSRPTR